MSRAAKKYRITAQLWQWPGAGGWHFVALEKPLAATIRKTARTYGSGFVKISVTVGKQTWETALFPQTRSATYLIAIKKVVREREGLVAGDTVHCSFAIL